MKHDGESDVRQPLLSADSVSKIASATEMGKLLNRDDLPLDGTWWTAVVSTCTSGLLGAEFGLVDAREWGVLLVRALDRARTLTALSEEEVVHRRIIGAAAAMRYFGAQKGDVSRDPELVFDHLFQALGGSITELLARGRETADRLSTLGSDELRRSQRNVRWLSSVKLALETVCDILPFMTDDAMKGEATAWCQAAQVFGVSSPA